MKSLSTRRNETAGQERLYCIYCNEELGADPTRCIYCGAPRTNPLGATSAVRHDVPDPLNWTSNPRPPASRKRRIISLLVPLSVVATDPHASWHLKLLFSAGILAACVCALPIALAMTWATRKGRLEWRVVPSVAEKLTAVCIAAYVWVTLTQPSASDVTSCYGACAGKIDGVSGFAIVVTGAVILAVLMLVALLATMRSRAAARLSAAASQSRSLGAGRSRILSNDPWGSTRSGRAAASARRR